MNKLIAEELRKVSSCELPNWDENTTEIIIPKLDEKVTPILRVNHYYLIKFEPYIVNEPDNFSLSANWNNGTTPKYYYNKCEVSQIMGKMVKLNCVGYDIENDIDINYTWSGWIPNKGINILKELT